MRSLRWTRPAIGRAHLAVLVLALVPRTGRAQSDPAQAVPAQAVPAQAAPAQAAPAQAAPAQAAPPGLSRFVPPRLLERAEPVYPEEARRAGLSGTVLVQIVIERDGSVRDAQVAHGAGHGFDEAALEAVRRLHFAPATQDGVPISTQINYELHFELQELPKLEDTVRASGTGPGDAVPAAAMSATIEGERPFSAASARTVRDRDFLLRPRITPEDILRVVPGLVLAQHQGGGKADQIFLRGFDADHGTDVSVNLDGIPVNMPSHAHGQGFADLHFLIPEVIERVEITKGPYFADSGDFDTAGAVNLVTRKRFDGSQVSVMGGLFPTLDGTRNDGSSRRFSGYRVLGVASPGEGSFQPFFAAEVFGSGGPFLNAEKLQRYNLFAKASFELSPRTTVSILAMAYASSWIGSGQIPARLVDSGVLDRYGAIDPTEGGDTQRQQAILALTTHPTERSTFTASVSALRYGLTLFDDFTFQAVNRDHGDELEQDDQRTSLFANLRYERSDQPALLGGGHLISTLGAQYRNDDILASLYKVEKRVRLAACNSIDNPCVNTNDRQTDASAFIQEDFRPLRWLRVVLGLRTDLFVFDVRSQKPGFGLDEQNPGPIPPAVQRSIQSPKASVVISPIEALDLYFNYGTGFHSNDARAAVESGGAGALPRATGYEVGARARLLDSRLELAAALWRLDLDSELVWSGDAGGTEPSDPTRRQGIELEARYQLLSWLHADLDVSLAKSRFKTDSGNGNAVALAPPRIITGGITAQHPSGLRGSLRLRHIGERPGSQLSADDPLDPLNPSGPRAPPCNPTLDPNTRLGARCYLIAEGYTVFDATLAWETPRYLITLVLENLTNAVYREAQFGNVSQVITPPPGAGPGFIPETHNIQDIHYTPGNPLGVQLGATLKF